MATEKSWNLSVGLSTAGHKAVVYAAAQHGLSVRTWGARVVAAGSRLAMFGDFLRGIAGDGKQISRAETVALVKQVEVFKIAADPHPRRVPLPQDQIEAIADSIREPLNSLVAREMGRQRSLVLGPRNRQPCKTEITLCLNKAVHNLVLGAATVSRRTKRELAQDLLESAGSMGRVAGLKRQARLCGGDRVGAKDIVETWIEMLVAAGCISCGAGSSTARSREFRAALLQWYDQHSHRGVEMLEADLDEGAPEA